MRMKRNICVSCGGRVLKSALTDPYMCRDCERRQDIEISRYMWLDA